MQICVKCQAQYLTKQLGVTVIEMSGNPPKPMRLWSADLMACPICGAELLSHFGHEPMMESCENGFDTALAEIPQGQRYILHNPFYLGQTVKYETTYVRPYDKPIHLRTTDRRNYR